MSRRGVVMADDRRIQGDEVPRQKGYPEGGGKMSQHGPKPRPAIERLMAKVAVNDSGCWIFTGCLVNGYSRIQVGSRTDGLRKVPGHRLAYEDAFGPIPAGFELDHFRMNDGPRKAPCSRACVNPGHLEAVSHRTNLLRGKGPSARNAGKTHCPSGHSYAEHGFRRASAPNARSCRPCRAAAKRRRRALHTEEAQ